MVWLGTSLIVIIVWVVAVVSLRIGYRIGREVGILQARVVQLEVELSASSQKTGK